MEKSQQMFQELQRVSKFWVVLVDVRKIFFQEQEANAVNDETIEKQRGRIMDIEHRYEELTARLEEEEETNVEVSKLKRKVESELEQLKLEISEMQLANEKVRTLEWNSETTAMIRGCV